MNLFARILQQFSVSSSFEDEDEDIYKDFFDSYLHSVRGLQDSPPENTTTDEEDAADDDGSNSAATALSYIFLFFLIFGLSATVEIKNLKKQLQNKFAICTGVAMQFLIMPVLGFVAVISLQSQKGWTREIGVALLVVTSSPGGSYSNWWCSLFNADLALSVAMTTVSSLLSMAMLPLNLFLYTFLAYGRGGEESVVEALDFGTIFLALGIVLFAITSGLYASYRNDNRAFHVMANRLGSISGLLLVLFSVFISSGADGAENNFWNQEWAFYVGVAFPCLVGMAVANVIARGLRLAHPETVAIAIECCYQNTGIATSVAIAMYDDKEERARAVAVPLFYGVVEAVSIGIYCVWAWKIGWTKAPKDETLCLVLANTYQVEEEDAFADEYHGGDDEVESLDRREDYHRDSSNSTAGETPSVATSRFLDEQGDLTEINEEAQEKPIDAAAATTVPFWRRWFGGHQRPSNSSNKNKAPFRNDAALAAVRSVAGDDGAVVKISSYKKDSPSSSMAELPPHGRDRSYTVETSASSSGSSIAASAIAGGRGPISPGVTPTRASQIRSLELSLPDALAVPTTPGMPPPGLPPQTPPLEEEHDQHQQNENGDGDYDQEAPASFSAVVTPTSINSALEEDDEEEE
ncbi:hypothetical protein ACA910_014837 [Epithemia clementina (nom. ined.)]